jgi:hypothetical protein
MLMLPSSPFFLLMYGVKVVLDEMITSHQLVGGGVGTERGIK